MDANDSNADGQAALWNGPAGRGWVEAQDLLDGMFQPFETLLAEGVPEAAGARVLDVGCGTGSTTLAIARRLGGNGTAAGIDISAPMIAAARARAERERLPASFLRANAETHVFAHASFDRVVSRFGVMFFDDPVRAFANLREAAVDGAALHVFAWRSAAENPFMTTAERAAAPLLPDMPARRPGAPGQFAFADAARVRPILEAAGWAEIDIEPVDLACTLPEDGLMRYLTWVGPVGQKLQEVDEVTRARVAAVARAAFEPYVKGSEVQFVAACWAVTARAAKRPR